MSRVSVVIYKESLQGVPRFQNDDSKDMLSSDLVPGSASERKDTDGLGIGTFNILTIPKRVEEIVVYLSG